MIWGSGDVRRLVSRVLFALLDICRESRQILDQRPPPSLAPLFAQLALKQPIGLEPHVRIAMMVQPPVVYTLSILRLQQVADLLRQSEQLRIAFPAVAHTCPRIKDGRDQYR